VNTLPRIVVAGGDGGSRSQHMDDSPRLQQRFGVQSIPTLLVMREQKVASRQVVGREKP